MPEDGTHWTRKDGSRIPIVDMDDAHLINTIFFIQRNREKAVAEGFGPLYRDASEAHLPLSKVGRKSQWESWLDKDEPDWIWRLPSRALEFDYQLKFQKNRLWSMPMNFGLLYGLDEPIRLTVWQRLLLGKHPG